MSDKFYQEYMCVPFEPDPVFEAFVSAWEAYHKAADTIDGHLRYPDPKTRNSAVKAGKYAMAEYLYSAGFEEPRCYEEENYKLWQSAKMEALRRMERCEHARKDRK